MKKFALIIGMITLTTVACKNNANQLSALDADDRIVENENESEKEARKDMTWSYQAQELWEIVCGESQSPIDIETDKVQTMIEVGTIELNYNNNDIETIIDADIDTEDVKKIVDTGKGIEVVKGGSAIINGREFNLLQYHFHSHSEHTVDGEEYPLEVHFVHQSESGRLAVVGVFLVEGQENEAISKILDNFKSGEIVEVAGFDVSSLLPENKSYYHYLGSLTTPPVIENVEWYVMQNPIEISQEQIDDLRKIYDGNNREIQSLNNRNVLIYKE